MKFLFLLMCLAGTLITVSCKQHATDSDSTINENAVYACPMKCEGDKVYTEPGKCPVCGMDLKPIAPTTSFEMKLVTTPGNPEAGTPITLAFTPRKTDDDAAMVPLDEVHDEKIHVIVVSDDLAWYSHIHPQYQADGSYTVQETFPAGGNYIIFTDYQPTGAGNQVNRMKLNVGGTPKEKETFTTPSLTTTTDGYQVTLRPLADKLITNNLNHLSVDVTRDGNPVTEFESIMGAKGHLVIISADGQRYLHVHPEEVDGQLDLHTMFDQPGLYRAYYQFQTEGKLHTSYFTIDVKEGQPGELGADEHDHGHDHNEGDHQH